MRVQSIVVLASYLCSSVVADDAQHKQALERVGDLHADRLSRILNKKDKKKEKKEKRKKEAEAKADKYNSTEGKSGKYNSMEGKSGKYNSMEGKAGKYNSTMRGKSSKYNSTSTSNGKSDKPTTLAMMELQYEEKMIEKEEVYEFEKVKELTEELIQVEAKMASMPLRQRH